MYNACGYYDTLANIVGERWHESVRAISRVERHYFFPAFLAAVRARVICFFQPKHWLQAVIKHDSSAWHKNIGIRRTGGGVLLALVDTILIGGSKRSLETFAIYGVEL